MDPATQLTEADVEHAREAREALTALIGGNNGFDVSAAALERLDRAAAKALLRVRFETGSTGRLEPAAGGLDGALGRFLAILMQARSDGLWPRFKICANGACRKAFYDYSTNRSGRWCNSSRCRSAINVPAFRRRHPSYQR